jgi:hypothetical protein
VRGGAEVALEDAADEGLEVGGGEVNAEAFGGGVTDLVLREELPEDIQHRRLNLLLRLLVHCRCRCRSASFAGAFPSQPVLSAAPCGALVGAEKAASLGCGLTLGPSGRAAGPCKLESCIGSARPF